MEQNTIATLEWNKIKEELQGYCASSLGAEKASKIVPLTQLEKIEFLQNKTADAIELIRKFSFPPLYGIHNLKEMMIRLKKQAVLENLDLIQIANSLRVSQSLKDYKSEHESQTNEVVKLIDKLYTNTRIQKEIERIVVDEDTISDDASRELFQIRKSIREKTEEARNKLNSIVKDDTTNLQDGFITMRDGRYVVPVKSGAKSKVPGITHDISASGQTLYIEPMAVVEINNKIRDLEIKEIEEIRRILKELSEMIFVYHQEIENNQYLLVDLDFTFAKAKYALDKMYTKPILNNEKIIDIKNAKHPLLKGKVVPIDVKLGEKYSALVITGPNTGGKTVSLKTLGLVIMMAQSGLYIPCDEFSKVAIFNNIYTDIGDNQSIEQSLSTFSASMTNIVHILKYANDRSLVLFDELGNGTDPTEGAALAMAIIDTLVKRGTLLVSTTHYSELKLYAMSTDGVQNANVEFNVETLSPTYKLIIGRPGKSNAFEISRRLGLSEKILSIANNYVSKENRDFEEIIAEIETDRIKLDNELLEVQKEKNKYEKLIDNFNKDVGKRKEKAESEIENAKIEARKILEDARRQSKEILKLAKSQKGNKESRQIDRAYSEITDKFKKATDKFEEKPVIKKKYGKNITVKLGETVKVISMNDLAVVQTLPDNKGDLTVQMGILKFNVNISDLAKTNKEIESEKSQSSYRQVLKNASFKDAQYELDVRGKTVEEAMIEIDSFFDKSILMGMKTVHIIHGKGTGALRIGLTEFFRKSRYVEEFRIGSIKEGGAGVTVVTLK
ncbi:MULTISPECIES: endonuclease MutS2 [Helcococcus]|uniref:Endonuclease MutS2 n=1 Tax=Helcococcus bovis TaxID=3153252 RepID=A0ABW9F4S2_9FIRM